MGNRVASNRYSVEYLASMGPDAKCINKCLFPINYRNVFVLHKNLGNRDKCLSLMNSVNTTICVKMVKLNLLYCKIDVTALLEGRSCKE